MTCLTAHDSGLQWAELMVQAGVYKIVDVHSAWTTETCSTLIVTFPQRLLSHWHWSAVMT